MKITELNSKHKDAYNNFVKHTPGYSFLQAWEWGDWQEQLGHKAFRFAVFDNTDTIIASVLCIAHATPLGSYLYCPYGPLLSPAAPAETLKLFIDHIKQNFPSMLCLRLEPTQKLDLATLGGVKAEHIQPSITLTLDLALNTEQLLASFHPKHRYNIKLAEKHSVTVTTSSAANSAVIKLISQTAERQDYRNHGQDYIQRLWEFFHSHPGTISVHGYLAEYQGKPAASGLMIDFGQTRMYLFGGSDYSMRQYMAPFLLHWKALQDAKATGLRVYDLGASETASGKSGGFMRFKLGFNPKLVEFGGTFDFSIRTTQYKVYRIFRKVNRILKHL